MKLKDKVAIVSGAAGGLGQVFCRALALQGACVVATDKNDASFVANEIIEAGGKAIAILADISNPESVNSMVQQTIETFGRIDILVNNAAYLPQPKPFESISEIEWDLTMNVNLKGFWLCAKAVVPTMREQKNGRIINISSSTFWEGVPMMLPYVASKGAVVGFTRALAKELTNTGITVNTLAPGLTVTEQNAEFLQSMSEKIIPNRIIQREQKPEDLTGALLFLCADESSFMTGQTLLIDGGINFN